jgi:undecaprenyl-diphosphatase
MDWLQALILGLLQGLAEFLPISSSGHLEIGHKLLGVRAEENLSFTVLVHGATVLSTIVIFYKEIGKLITGLFCFHWNDETKYILKIALSMIPVLVIGLLFEDQIESLFTGSLILVGAMLLVTAGLLAFTHFARDQGRKIHYLDAILIGIAQAVAVLPGISRSGATISTALLLGNMKKDAARFSFLMVLLPIIGANTLKLMDKDGGFARSAEPLPLVVGFLAAFISGLLACRWMLSIVQKGKLTWFALYCFIIGSIAIISALIT